MFAHRLNPILNVSSFSESVAWFERLGWKKGWDWGNPPSFGGVCSGHCEIFLCENGQGGRGKGSATMTFGPDGDQTGDKGVWMSVWVDDVDVVHQHCVDNDIEVTWPRRICPGTFAKCMCDIPTGTCLELVSALNQRSKTLARFCIKLPMMPRACPVEPHARSYSKHETTAGCHGLAPWSLTLDANST